MPGAVSRLRARCAIFSTSCSSGVSCSQLRNRRPQSLLKTPLTPDDEHLYTSNNHHRNFFECMRTRRDPVAHVEAGHTATTLTLVADIATRLGRELTWDWKTERFVNDDQANQMLQRPMRSPWCL